MNDPVNHPSHYQAPGGRIQVREILDVIEAFDLGFNLGNAAKYLIRAGKKADRLEDLRKARFYLDREISNIVDGPPWELDREDDEHRHGPAWSPRDG